LTVKDSGNAAPISTRAIATKFQNPPNPLLTLILTGHKILDLRDFPDRGTIINFL
jgi:hypothetical protein